MAKDTYNCPIEVVKRLRLFGRNPAGENIFRVVWSPRRLVWLNEEMVQEYSDCKPQWILEKWLSAEDYCDCGPEEWKEKTLDPETGRLILGPFPSEGFFVECYRCGEGVPLEPSVIELLCQLIEAGKAVTPGEKALAVRRKHEKAEAEKLKKQREEWDEAQDSAALGAEVDRVTQPVTGPNNVFKRRDDVKLPHSAEDLAKVMPVPQRGGKTKQM